MTFSSTKFKTSVAGIGSSGASSSNGIIVGGSNATVYLGTTDSWDGTSWTAEGSLSTNRADGQGTPQGSSSTALYSGGNSAPTVATTEEYTGPSATVATKTLTSS
jgi:hypothetical protein